MAITWDVQIDVIDIPSSMVSVIATRTDDGVAPPDVKTYSVLNAIIDTTAQKTALLNFIWDQHQAALAKQAQVNAIVSELEAAAKANLEAREI